MTHALLLAILSTLPYVHHTPVLEDFVRVQADRNAHAAGMHRLERPGSPPVVVYVGYDQDAFYAAFIYNGVDPPTGEFPLNSWTACADTNGTTAIRRTSLGFVVLITVPIACENEVSPS